MKPYTLPFKEISISDLPAVGGKNASLGEMFNKLLPLGIEVPDGFAVTVECYRRFLSHNNLSDQLKKLLDGVDTVTLSNLPEIALQCRTLVSNGDLPEDVKEEILKSFQEIAGGGENLSFAARSSATAEDLPTASFAGQHESFLNIKGEENLLQAIQLCYVSLFHDRAIKYRIDNGFDHMQVGLSVGVQVMVRSDLGCSGVNFTIDPESGFDKVVYITGAWGLGENIVQGAVIPDEFWVFKPTLLQGRNAVISRKKGAKENTMVYDERSESGRKIKNLDTPIEKRNAWILSDSEILKLARCSCEIEKHYGMAMDIEWAKDGINNKIYIVQARPETIFSQKKHGLFYTYKLKEKGKLLCRGKAVGKKIISGRACIIHSLTEANKLQTGDILIAEITNPDWNSLLRKAVSIVTNKGGRTSHASIVARELGIAAIVGTGNATQIIKDGQIITVANVEGEEGDVLDGNIPFDMQTVDLTRLPATKTKPLFILADPDRAFELSYYPAKGVGLLRMEFIINNSILIHPMALVQFDQLPEGPVKNTIAQMTAGYKTRTEYFVQQLAESIAKCAAAFYPKELILRMSDFKTNEYASLIGGQYYEPKEENPMIGFRGASRYYDKRYAPGFGLECEAVKKIRNEMGFTNVKLMIPFCRTVAEARQVLQTMESFGLKRGENGLEVYLMIEIPSNVILADEFAKLFDGFSIGSNDLTQLTLGIDRDSAIVSHLFDENNEAVKIMIAKAINAAKKAGIKIGLCGQAPSDFPEFSQFLVEQGIDTISFTPDALIRGIENIAKAEMKTSKNFQNKTDPSWQPLLQ